MTYLYRNVCRKTIIRAFTIPTKTTFLTKHLEMAALIIVQTLSSMRKSTNYCPDFFIICYFPSACTVQLIAILNFQKQPFKFFFHTVTQ